MLCHTYSLLSHKAIAIHQTETGSLMGHRDANDGMGVGVEGGGVAFRPPKIPIALNSLVSKTSASEANVLLLRVQF